jgi:hypothetical protein
MHSQTFFEIREQGKGKRKLKVRVKDEHGSLYISPEGYGENESADGDGFPVFLEIWEGRLRLVVAADINEKDPKVIDLESAKESNRNDNVERISIMPQFTEAKAKEMNTVMERKGHLEYLCFMMLQELSRKCSLEQLLKLGVQRDIVDADAVQEFFGDRKASEEAGCGQAEGHTIPSLLEEWQETTEKMMTLMRQA